MATITGKRFQMTDGAASPINLFPYTVSEAVYGLNNSISNAISSALSTISLSTYAGTSAIGSSVQPVYYNGSALVATDLSTTYAPYNAAGYLPLTGGTLTGSGGNDVLIQLSTESATSWMGFRPSDGTFRYIGINNSNELLFQYASLSCTVWHAGNSNSTSVPWSASSLTLAGAITGATTIYATSTITAESTILCRNELDVMNPAGTLGSQSRLGFTVAERGYVGYIDAYWDGSDWSSSNVAWGHMNFVLSTPTGLTTIMAFSNVGNVGIGATSPTEKLHVVGNILSTGDQIINSDLTLKTNLQDVTYSVSDIAKCRAVTFDWKDGHGHSAGSIAQDWKPLIPELVHGEEGNMTLAYGQIALVNSILEAREIERLKERVAELEKQLKMRS